jgi:hypothetical protein
VPCAAFAEARESGVGSNSVSLGTRHWQAPTETDAPPRLHADGIVQSFEGSGDQLESS